MRHCNEYEQFEILLSKFKNCFKSDLKLFFLYLSGAKSGGRSHVFLTLTDMDTHIRSEFASALKDLSKIVSEVCKQEKVVWVDLEELEERCHELTKRVDETTRELVCHCFHVL